MHLTIKKIAELVNGKVIGDENETINLPAKIEEAQKGSITFCADPKYLPHIALSKASAYLVDESLDVSAFPGKNFIVVDHVYTAVSTLLSQFEKSSAAKSGVSSKAQIHETATIGKDVFIDDFAQVGANSVIHDGAKLMTRVHIGQDCTVGKDTVVHAGVSIYHGCQIGNDCIIHANTVVGSDGFGFVRQDDGTYKKIPQVGIVRIEDQVEIGANCTIDRASMGQTLIKHGAKLDNLIHIAHNVVIGEHTVIAAQVGIAGSTTIGAHCMIGGQCGIVGHLKIADGTLFQAKSGMTKSVKKSGTKWYGAPAIEYNNYLRSFAIFKNLEKLVHRVRDLEEKTKKFDKPNQ